MASRYWVGGTATWDGTTTANWAASTGGASGVSVPVATDDVFLDTNSGVNTITLSASSVSQSINCTGFTGTISHPAATTISIGSASAGASNVALMTVAGMTYTVGSTTTSIINFISTSATVQTLTTGGKTWPSYTINGAGSSYQLADNNTINAASTLTLTAGALDTNGKTCSWGVFSSSNSNTRALSLGASAITISSANSGTWWNIATSTNMTLNAGTSTLTFHGTTQSPNFAPGGFTYNNIVKTADGGGGFTLGGSFTCTNLTYVGSGGNYSLSLNSGFTFTITGTLTLTGLDAVASRMLVQSSATGTQRTIALGSTGTAVLTNVDFRDTTFTGTNTPASGTSIGDAQGNSNITFTTPVTRYWIGGTGSWNDPTHWSTSSGGTGGASVPIVHDSLVFDAASFTAAGQTVTGNVMRSGTTSMSAVTNNPTFDYTNPNGAGISYYGGLTFSPNMTVSIAGAAGAACGFTFSGRGSYNLDLQGVVFPANTSIAFSAFGGTYTLQSDVVVMGTFGVNNGTINANGFNVTCTALLSSNASTRTITLGSGNWTLNGTGSVIQLSTLTNLTLNAGTSTILITDTSASSKTIAHGGAITLNNLTITGGGSGSIIFGANVLTLNTLTVANGPTTVSLTAGNGSTNVPSVFNINGSAGNIVSVVSGTGGSLAYLTIGTSSTAHYASFQDISANAGSSIWAIDNCTNVSNNHNVIFAQPVRLPSGGAG